MTITLTHIAAMVGLLRDIAADDTPETMLEKGVDRVTVSWAMSLRRRARIIVERIDSGEPTP